MERLRRKIPILFAEWLLNNTDIFILKANSKNQKIYYHSGVYKDIDILFDLFANERHPKCTEYKQKLNIADKPKKPTKKQQLVFDNFNFILNKVENGESISSLLKKLNISRRSFYTHSTKEQRQLLNMALVARRKTKCYI